MEINLVETTFAEKIHLETEDEAWIFLRDLLDEKVTFEDLPKLTFGDWAKIDAYIPGAKYNSALTPYMMKGWLELQRSIYRSYSIAQGGRGDGKTLSEAEKDRLELIVEVKGGSSDQAVDVQAILEQIAGKLVENMGPTETLIAIMTIVLTLGGASVVKSWLATKKEIKLAEIEALKTKDTVRAHTAALETIAQVAGVDMERRQLIADATKKLPVVAALTVEADTAREALVKHLSKEDARINGVEIKADAARAVTTNTRIESDEARLDGLYKVRKVDTTVATGFRVHVSDQQGKELVGDVAEVMTTIEDRKVIQEAEWSKVPVFLQINARQRRGRVTDAVIVRARSYDPTTDGNWRAE